ncbi:MAG: hypothetical protein HN416_13920 [Nitrospina sp.]|jgi:hypothetical protein|nr:hypothetical protein [Nitrospina sp.]
MSPYYPSNMLRRLRNEIPIDSVIEHMLSLDVKNAQHILRFQCPICFNFHTATNHLTNLARCFDCQKNFNPIDLVIAVRECSFIEAVHFLTENTSIK